MLAARKIDHQLVVRPSTDLLQPPTGRPHLGMQQAGLLQHQDVHRRRRGRQPEVLGDPVDRHDPVTEIAQDGNARLAAEGLEHVQPRTIGHGRVDVQALARDRPTYGHERSDTGSAGAFMEATIRWRARGCTVAVELTIRAKLSASLQAMLADFVRRVAWRMQTHGRQAAGSRHVIADLARPESTASRDGEKPKEEHRCNDASLIRRPRPASTARGAFASSPS